MDQPYYLEVVMDTERINEHKETLHQRFPHLEGVYKSYFFFVMRCELDYYTEQDKAFLQRCIDDFTILRFRCKKRLR